MDKSDKFLTNPKYSRVLEAVLLSPRPLTTKAIVANRGDMKDKDIYRIIRELVSIKEPAELLFEWNKISGSDSWYNYVTIRRLNKIFRLGWDTTTLYQDCLNGNVKFMKKNNESELSIEYGSQLLEFKLNKAQENSSEFVAVLQIFNRLNGKNKPKLRKTYNLIFTKKRNDFLIQMIQRAPSIKYLLPMDIKDDIKSINEYWHKCCEIFGYSRYPNICDISKDGRVDRENWKYRPNIRGLLLYIVIRINSKAKNGPKDNNGRIHDHIISNILRNLSANYFDDFPFLLHYKTEFEAKFDLLAKHGYIPEKFFITLIKDIAEQLTNSLDKVSLEELTYQATRRFYNEIDYHFRSGIICEDGLATPSKFETLGLTPDLSVPVHQVMVGLYAKVIEYLCVIGSYIKEEEKKKFDDLNNDLNLYYEQDEFLKLGNELEAKFKSVLNSNADSISPLISFYDLLDNIPVNEKRSTFDGNNLRQRVASKLTSFLESMVEHYSGFEAVGLCVIRKSVFNGFKLRLSKSDASIIEAPSLFIEQGIPEAYHYILLSKLGFQ